MTTATKKLSRKEILDTYLDNVDKYGFERGLGNMKTHTCAIGVIGVALSFTETPEFKDNYFGTDDVIQYIRERSELTYDELQNIVDLNDAVNDKERAKNKIKAYLS